jgi:peptide/nickel transport system permease protein
MLGYIVNRLLQSIGVLVGVSILVFSLIQLIPGGPAMMILGEDASAEQIAIINHNLGIDRPLHVQYLDWLVKVCEGDFGRCGNVCGHGGWHPHRDRFRCEKEFCLG